MSSLAQEGTSAFETVTVIGTREKAYRSTVAPTANKIDASVKETPFHGLTPLQSAVLRVLAVMGKDYAPFEQGTVERYRSFLGIDGEDTISAQNVQAALSSLQEKALVWRASRGVYAMEDDGLTTLLQERGHLDLPA